MLSLADIAHYLRDVANCAPAIYLVVLAVTLLLCYPAASKNPRRGLALSAMWASPLLLLALGHYRDLRYAAPLFPALALALGILLDSAFARYGAFAGAAACLLLGLGVASMLQTDSSTPAGRTALSGRIATCCVSSTEAPHSPAVNGRSW